MKPSQALQTGAILSIVHALLIGSLVVLNQSDASTTPEGKSLSVSVFEFPSPADEREEMSRTEPRSPTDRVEESEPSSAVAGDWATAIDDMPPEVSPLETRGHVLDVSSPLVSQNFTALRPNPIDVPAPSVRSAKDVDTPPVPARGNRQPPYPPSAERREWTGSVNMRLLIGTDGRVRSAIVQSHRGADIFRRTVIDAVESWRYTPAEHEGRRVEVWLTKSFRFELTD